MTLIIIFFSVRPNGNKPNDVHLRNKKTDSKNIGGAIGLDNIIKESKKIAGEHVTSKVFDELAKHMPGLEILRGPGIQVGTGVILGLLDHMKKDCPLNKDGNPVNFVSTTQISSSGINSTFHHTVIIVGHKVSSLVLRNLSYRACDTEIKEL